VKEEIIIEDVKESPKKRSSKKKTAEPVHQHEDVEMKEEDEVA
jgi:hypothetical protein